MKTKIIILLIGLLLSGQCYAQKGQYSYKRDLTGVDGQWHKINLPDDIYTKVSPSFHDIRIYGIKANKDTIEAPYILHVDADKLTERDIPFKIINPAKNEKGFYYTFEIEGDYEINEISPLFSESNFDLRVTLEGSQNRNEWFEILDNYRLLSIRNENTNYSYTRIQFPPSRYRYFRILIQGNFNPGFSGASITLKERKEAQLREYKVSRGRAIEDKEGKQSIIDIELEEALPVSFLQIGVRDTFDYYRPIRIRYLADSTKTEKGWKYNYRELTSATLSSLERNEFRFASTIVRNLQVLIDNHDNQALRIENFVVKGNTHELMARFTEPADWMLVYGDKNATAPRYDIAHYLDKIPASIPALSVGAEVELLAGGGAIRQALFVNKTWLWLLMIVIISVLGWFTLRMMRKG